LDAVTRLLSDLVAIPSVNPMGRGLSGPGFGEAGMSDYLEAWFRDLGVAVERRVVAPGRDNVIARYEAPRPGRTILFDAHQDTVPTDGMTIDPFRPEIRDGRLHGRGSCDIKGGMAAMLTAFARLVRERPGDSSSVVMACTVDEEFTHIGSSLLAGDVSGFDLGIIAEPTKLDIVEAHKGALRWKIRAEGTACHSSTPDLGDNAIYRMAGVVSALAEFAKTLRDAPTSPRLGPQTLSVGRIEGGTSVNVVPDWAEIEIDRRLNGMEPPGGAVAEVEAYVRARLGNLDRIAFLPPFVRMPALLPIRDNPHLPPVKAAIARVGGREPEVLGVPYGTDAGPLGEAGLPCFVFGPGDIAQAHTKDEWIDLDQLRLGSEMYFEIARGRD